MKLDKYKTLFIVAFSVFVFIVYLIVSNLLGDNNLSEVANDKDTTTIKARDWNDNKLDADKKAYYDYLNKEDEK